MLYKIIITTVKSTEIPEIQFVIVKHNTNIYITKSFNITVNIQFILRWIDAWVCIVNTYGCVLDVYTQSLI